MPQYNSGILYIAFGYEYVLMALHSAKTAQITNPNLKYAIVTNLHIRNIDQIEDVFCLIREVDMADEYNRSVKTRAGGYSPFEKTLLLDVDTEVNGDLSPMFKCLDRFDVIAKLNPEPTVKDFSISPQIPGYVFPTWNTGVIFFNFGAKTDRLFSEWNRIFLEMQGNRDQPAFARTIYENPDIKLLSVNCIWNMNPAERRFFIDKRSKLESRIWHYRDPDESIGVAQAIYKLHTECCKVFAQNNPERGDVNEVERRYSVMLKPWYRLQFFRKLLLMTTKSLKRPKKTTGKSFKRK